MTLSQVARDIPGITTRKYTEGGTPLIGFMGPQKKIAQLIGKTLLEGYKPDGIVAIGIRKDGAEIHLVAFDTNDGQKIGEGQKTQIDDATLRDMWLKNHHYMHLLATMKDGVNAAVFQKGFRADAKTGKAFGNVAKNLFDNGHVVGDESTNTALLLAPKGEREFFACRYGYKGPLTQIELPKDLKTVEQRFTVVDRQTVLVASYGGSTLHAISAKQIDAFFKDGVVPEWQKVMLPNNIAIEDMSLGIDGTQTVILTAKVDGIQRLIPASITWNKTKTDVPTCAATLTLDDAIKFATAPIVRVSAKSKRFVAVDGNGGSTRLQIARIDELGESFVRLIRKVSHGAYQAAA